MPANASNRQAQDQQWDMTELLPEEEQDDKTPKWLKICKLVLPHIGLILLSCLYVVVGALIFFLLEEPNEMAVKSEQLTRINCSRSDVMRTIWNSLRSDLANVPWTSMTTLNRTLSTTTSSLSMVLRRSTSEMTMDSAAETDVLPSLLLDRWQRSALSGLDNLTSVLFKAYDSQYIKSNHILAADNQTLLKAHDTWTMWNAIFFTSTLLTTIGYGNVVPMTLNGRMFCLAYGLFGVPLILITVADIGKFLSEHIVWMYCQYVDFKKSMQRRLVTRSTPADIGDIDECTDNEDEEMRMRDELERFGLEDYISIPVSLVLSILMAYVAAGALLLGLWEEDWDFFTGFYFSFITMTTIGFGDIVPTKQEYYLLDLLYIIVGLAITTMCIDLVGIQYIRKIHYFGRAIKDARYALVNVGGRMVHVGDLMKYASVLQKKYGLKGGQVGAFENPFELFPGSYKPRDLRRIRYIDSTFDSNDQLLRTNHSITSGHGLHHTHTNSLIMNHDRGHQTGSGPNGNNGGPPPPRHIASMSSVLGFTTRYQGVQHETIVEE